MLQLLWYHAIACCFHVWQFVSCYFSTWIFDMYMSYGWGLLVKTWRQSDTRRDVRALHDVTSDMSHRRQDFITWLLHKNAHPASRISQYDNSHPVRCFWILLEFRNTIVRVRSRVIRYMIIEKKNPNHTSFNQNYVVPCICLRAIWHMHGSMWRATLE